MRMQMSFDTRKLENALGDLSRAANVELGKVMKEESKYILRSIMKLTPPATGAQGRAAVKADLAKVYDTPQGIYKRVEQMSFPGVKPFLAAMVKAIRSRDDGELRNLLIGPIQATQSVTVAPHTRGGLSIAGYTAKRSFQRPSLPQITGATVIGGSVDTSMHKGRRNPRGKVAGGGLSQIVTVTKSLRDYQKKVRDSVGWHVAGWVALARQVGEKVPAWVAKTRLEATAGTAVTNFGKKPFIRGVNLDVKIPKYQRTVDDAIRFRLRITAKKLEAVLRGRAVNLGFTRIPRR